MSLFFSNYPHTDKSGSVGSTISTGFGKPLTPKTSFGSLASYQSSAATSVNTISAGNISAGSNMTSAWVNSGSFGAIGPVNTAPTAPTPIGPVPTSSNDRRQPFNFLDTNDATGLLTKSLVKRASYPLLQPDEVIAAKKAAAEAAAAQRAQGTDEAQAPPGQTRPPGVQLATQPEEPADTNASENFPFISSFDEKMAGQGLDQSIHASVPNNKMNMIGNNGNAMMNSGNTNNSMMSSGNTNNSMTSSGSANNSMMNSGNTNNSMMNSGTNSMMNSGTNSIMNSSNNPWASSTSSLSRKESNLSLKRVNPVQQEIHTSETMDSSVESAFQNMAKALEEKEETIKELKIQIEATWTAICMSEYDSSKLERIRGDPAALAHRMIVRLQTLTDENKMLGEMLSHGRAAQKEMEIGAMRREIDMLKEKLQASTR